LPFVGKDAQPSIRITVDTIEDLENVRSIFKQGDIDPWRISILEIVKRMDPSII
jgi:spore coat polysaccharide biosynthesis protein SpsF (cytidylyltransferase family)